ncbi:hypothetical protein KEM48_009400 [Puccinia striiformis f. sp. tritici PST-130]|nr:hypothetical protein KEM48_009400 [Puccinia striiformis f. sp. tritici PST-130]
MKLFNLFFPLVVILIQGACVRAWIVKSQLQTSRLVIVRLSRKSQFHLRLKLNISCIPPQFSTAKEPVPRRVSLVAAYPDSSLQPKFQSRSPFIIPIVTMRKHHELMIKTTPSFGL